MGEAKGKQTHLGGEGMWNRAEERGTYDQNVLYGVLKELIKKLKRKTKKWYQILSEESATVIF